MPFPRTFLGVTYTRLGHPEEAQQILDGLMDDDGKGLQVSLLVGVLQEALGMEEEALSSLNRSIEKREPLAYGLTAMKGFLRFPSLRTKPEFEVLLKKVDRILSEGKG